MPYHFRLPRFSSLLTTVIVLAVLISSLALPQRSAHAATTYTVTSTADTGGVCPDATNCTLRQALTLVANGNTVAFNIAGLGVQTITVASNLPPITATNVTIDGTTQSGIGGVPLIQLSGNGTPTIGIDIQGSTDTVNGLIINGFTAVGINDSGSRFNMSNNYIGTNSTGSAAAANGEGVLIVNTGAPIISSNVISGNTNNGIDIINSFFNIVFANKIGVGADGITALPNGGAGVSISNNSRGSLIGNGKSGNSNIIANNGGAGVVIGNTPADTSSTNAVLNNSIYNNAASSTKLGIDLGNDGVTPNSTDTNARALPNEGQNYPVLTSAVPDGLGNITISGTLLSIFGPSFILEFYGNPDCSANQYGQGKTFLGTANVSTNTADPAPFSVTFPLPTGQIGITATVSLPGGEGPSPETSEFSQCIKIGITPAAPTPNSYYHFITHPDSFTHPNSFSHF